MMRRYGSSPLPPVRCAGAASQSRYRHVHGCYVGFKRQTGIVFLGGWLVRCVADPGAFHCGPGVPGGEQRAAHQPHRGLPAGACGGAVAHFLSLAAACSAQHAPRGMAGAATHHGGCVWCCYHAYLDALDHARHSQQVLTFKYFSIKGINLASLAYQLYRIQRGDATGALLRQVLDSPLGTSLLEVAPQRTCAPHVAPHQATPPPQTPPPPAGVPKRAATLAGIAWLPPRPGVL